MQTCLSSLGSPFSLPSPDSVIIGSSITIERNRIAVPDDSDMRDVRLLSLSLYHLPA